MVASRTAAANMAIVAARPPTAVVDVSWGGEHARRLQFELDIMAIEGRVQFSVALRVVVEYGKILGGFRGSQWFLRSDSHTSWQISVPSSLVIMVR